jgi:hypothetical protein
MCSYFEKIPLTEIYERPLEFCAIYATKNIVSNLNINPLNWMEIFTSQICYQPEV